MLYIENPQIIDRLHIVAGYAQIEAPKHARHKLGAWIFNNAVIEAKGVNFCKTHPIAAKLSERTGVGNIWLHAEVSALVKYKKKEFAEIYVARYGKVQGVLLLAKPCVACRLAIQEHGYIKKVYFSVNNSHIGVWRP